MCLVSVIFEVSHHIVGGYTARVGVDHTIHLSVWTGNTEMCEQLLRSRLQLGSDTLLRTAPLNRCHSSQVLIGLILSRG